MPMTPTLLSSPLVLHPTRPPPQENVQTRTLVPKQHFQNLDFINDIVLLSLILHTLVDALDIVVKEASPLRLTVSWTKTEMSMFVLLIGSSRHSIIIGLAKAEVVKDFV